MTFPAAKDIALCVLCLVGGITAGISQPIPIPESVPLRRTNQIGWVFTTNSTTLLCCPSSTNYASFRWYYGPGYMQYVGIVPTTNPFVTIPPQTTTTFWTVTQVDTNGVESAWVTNGDGMCSNLPSGYLAIAIRPPWQTIINVLVNGVVAGSLTNPVGTVFFRGRGQFVQMATNLAGPWTNKWSAPPGGVLSITRTNQ